MLTALWDAAVLLLVVFPLVTGGVWIDRPGLHLELAQLGIPVALVAALTALLARSLEPKKSFVIRWALELWRRWSRSGARGVVYGALVMGALLALASFRRHWALGSNADDLGIFQGALWNFVHGNQLFSPQKGTHLFRDHLYFNIYLLTPFFALIPRPETLLAIQAFGLALGAVPLHFLARQHAPKLPWLAHAVPLVYWLYLPTRNGNAFDFHPDMLMLPAALAAVAGLQSTRPLHRTLGALALLFVATGKESAGVVLFGLGAAWALGAAPEASRAFCRRLGLALMPAGFAWFWFETQWIPKQIFGASYAYSFAYSDLGEGLGGILTSPFRVPEVFFGRFLAFSRLKFLFWILGGMAFLPLLGWRQLIGAVPPLTMLFLTRGDHRVDLFYYYGGEASIFLFWALPVGWQKAWEWTKGRKPRFKPALLLAWVLFFTLALSGRSELYRIRRHSPTPHASWVKSDVLPCLAKEIPIAATGALIPQLHDRAWSAAIPRMESREGPVECVIIDRNLNPWSLSHDGRDAFAKDLLSKGFQPVFDCDGVQVLQRKSRCLECTPVCQRP